MWSFNVSNLTLAFSIEGAPPLVFDLKMSVLRKLNLTPKRPTGPDHACACSL